MKKLIVLFTFIPLLTAPLNDLLADGADVVLLLNSGSEINGELLSVRGNAFVIGRAPGASDEILERFPDAISVVPYDNVQKVTIEGKSYVLLGLGLGLVSGVAVGYAVGPSAEDEDHPAGQILNEAIGRPLSAGLGGLIGLLLGIAVGSAVSTGDAELDTSTLKSPYTLKPYARYQDDEPEFLKTIEVGPTGN
jgi:uncharacterized membrane protein (Fun14 family)